jgi:GNAT superfamily N-acetyltransferase
MSSQIGSSPEDGSRSGRSLWSGQIRALSDPDLSEYASHLLRLGQECRRARFGNYVSDNFVRAYIERFDPSNTLVLGCFESDEMRGAAELRSLEVDWCPRAEIAFSAEKPWRNRGIGTALMLHATMAARQLGLEQLFLSCHAFNRPMVRIAERASATLDFSDCECSATIAVNKALHPGVACELSDVVKVLNLPRGLPVGG